MYSNSISDCDGGLGGGGGGGGGHGQKLMRGSGGTKPLFEWFYVHLAQPYYLPSATCSSVQS